MSGSVELTFNHVNLDLINQILSVGPPESMFELSRDEVADILEKAADLYQAEQVEWCTQEWIKHEKPWSKLSVCAGGAIALASGIYPQLFYQSYGDVSSTDQVRRGNLAADPNYDKFREVLDRTAAYLGEPVPSWNDNRLTPRTKADVIDMLRRAAKGIRDNIDKESCIQ